MKRFSIILFTLLLLAVCRPAAAQQDTTWFNVDNELEILHQQIEEVDDPKFKPLHLIGVKYGYNFSNARVTPSMDTKWQGSPNCLSITYTYYNSLWKMLDIFGFQGEFKYYKDPVSIENLGDNVFTMLELSAVSQFRINFSRFRFLVNIGPYVGYRRKNDREVGVLNQYDNRFDYGLIGGLGFAVVFSPVEFHLEGNYKFALSSMYHANILSDQYWVFAYPSTIFASLGVFVNLW